MDTTAITDRAANTTSSTDGINGQAATTGVTPPVTKPSESAGGVPQGETYTKKQLDGIMAQARVKWEKDAADKAAEAALQEQGKYKELLEKRDADYKATQAKQDADLKASRLETEAYKVAATLKIEKPEYALKLIEQGAIVYDDKGTPSNLKELLEAVIKELPGLVTGATIGLPASGGATNAARTMGQPATVDPKNPWSGMDWDKK